MSAPGVIASLRQAARSICRNFIESGERVLDDVVWWQETTLVDQRTEPLVAEPIPELVSDCFEPGRAPLGW